MRATPKANARLTTTKMNQRGQRLCRAAVPRQARNLNRARPSSINGSKTTNSENTLGRAIDGCNVFPHEALRKCVKEFYKFASDYPNIRHAGNPASRIRDLKKDDALLAIGLALSFGTFVLDNDAGDAILDGEL